MSTVQDSPLAVQLQENQLNEHESAALQSTFEPFFQQAQEWRAKAEAIQVASADDKEGMKNAREARLALKNIRVDVEKKRKDLKEESLRKGKAIDGMANVIKYLVVPIEEHLQQQEDFVRIQEEKQKQELKETRERELMELEVDISFYNLAEMPEEQYGKLLETSKATHQEKKEAAEKAERERIEREKAEAEERERIRQENERLKAEAEAREKALAKERAKAEEERKRIEAEHQAKLEAERKERERIEADHLAKMESERKERERIEAKERAKVEAEEKAKRDEEEKKRQSELAPDKEKLVALADRIASIDIPAVSSKEAKAVVEKAVELLSQASQYVKTQSISLK